MALLDLVSEIARSHDGRAFANGHEGDAWMGLWCLDCVQDQDQCPLIGVALLGRTPAAWQDRDPGSLNRYICNEYQENANVDQEDEP